jgi:hypothetical protein
MGPVAVCPFAGDEHGTRPASAPQGHAASRWRGGASLDRLPPARSELFMQAKADWGGQRSQSSTKTAVAARFYCSHWLIFLPVQNALRSE